MTEANGTGTAMPAETTAYAKKRAKYILNIDRVSQLSPEEREKLKAVADKYAFRVNDYYLGLVNWDDPADPLRRLVIPDQSELAEWGALDASDEKAITVQRGVQHKYASTVLLLINEACGSYCRYCFRKRLFMNDNDEVNYDLSGGIQYINDHPEIDNVLLTGGDPLILQTPKIEELLGQLREIDHLKIIRFGTKMPAFNPFRFINDPDLLAALKRYSTPKKRIYFMLHFDHPNELTPESREGLRLLQETGVILINQSPIIRGISDDPDTMAKLWNELSYLGAPQYYVFQGRPTAGNSEFEVPIVESYFKIEEAKRQCSGLAKRLRYCMSHESGKVEILGVDDDYIYLKYHRAKDADNEQRIMVCLRNDQAYWLDQLEPAPGFTNPYYQSSDSDAVEDGYCAATV